MTHARAAIGVATAALLLAALASCANDGNDPAASESPTPSSPAPTTATTTPPSETQVASAAASALVRQYFTVIDRVSQNADVSLAKLSDVATSTQLAAEQRLLRSQRQSGLRQVGNTTVAQVQVQSVNLDNSDPSVGKVPTVQIDVCWDVSKVDVVEKSGKSVVSPSRPDTGWTRYTFANYHYSTDPAGGWRVATGQDLKRKPCAAS